MYFCVTLAFKILIYAQKTAVFQAAQALNYIFLFISLKNEAAKKYFLVSLMRFGLSLDELEVLEIYLLLCTAYVGDAQCACSHTAKFVSCMYNGVVVGIVQQ